MKPTDSTPLAPHHVNSLVPYAHVADVEQSLAFYALFGLGELGRHRDPSGRAVWAQAGNGQARIMLAQAGPDLKSEEQAVLFYMYCDDVEALRAYLLAHGVFDGGKYCGQPGPNGGRRVVFEVNRPFYMEHGELRVSDPDGYVILVGQLS